MKNHFHLRLTPSPKDLPAITPDLSGMLGRFEKYVLSHEVSKDSIPHYHLYGETDECEKTVRTHIVATCKIPIVGRGKVNGYYCFKFNQYSRPSPEYVCAEGDIRASKGYTQEEIAEYIEAGKKYIGNKTLDRQILPASEASAIRSKEQSMDDLWLQFIEDVIPKDLASKGLSYTIDQFRASTLTWFRDRGNGRFNLNTYKQFVVCGWLQVDLIRKRAMCISILDIEKYGV